jgi:potassium/hydrogen antiporter
MTDIPTFAGVLTVLCAVIALGVVSSRVSQWVRIPAPAIFLIGAAVASELWPTLGQLSITTVQRVATAALVLILFDGGMHIGWRRFRQEAAAITWLGVAGTLVTAAAMAVAAHWLFGFAWRPALLLGTALSPTDPAVVFSVLGRREIAGRSGLLLEGESGANDPVGIALMASLLMVGGHAGPGAVAHAVGEFALQMGVGAAVGLAGGAALAVAMRRLTLPSEGLYPLRTLAGAGLVYGLATLGHGSGFLAVFVAGIVIGDVRAPYEREVRRFHSALASLAEIVVFTVLGLTVQLRTMPIDAAWLIGLAMALLLCVVVRPVLVGLVLLPIRLARHERLFVLWSGLKGAVPVLLGTYILSAGVDHAVELYDVVVVVVAFSVIVQGGLVPTVAGRLGLPLRPIEPGPWSLGVRLRAEPEGLHRFTVADGSPADGALLDRLRADDGVWVSVVTRSGALLPLRASTHLRAGDEVLLVGESRDPDRLAAMFGNPEAADPDDVDDVTAS